MRSRPVVAASIDRETFPDRAGFGGAPLGPGLAERITRLVEETYSFEYSFHVEVPPRIVEGGYAARRSAVSDISYLTGLSIPIVECRLVVL